MAELITCQSCGLDEVEPGLECLNCGFVMPGPPASTAAGGVARARCEQRDLMAIEDGTTILLGRLSESEVVRSALRDFDYVGRKHAEIVLRGDRLVVRDLGSKHGTRVGDHVVGPEGQDFELPVTIRLGLRGHEATIVVEWRS